MSNWKLVTPNEAKQSWDLWLQSLNGSCLYQTYSWGAHKEKIGQPQTRLILFNDSNIPLVMLQGQLKHLPFGIQVLWVPGGPVGDLGEISDEALLQIKRLLGAKYLLIRASIMRERNANDVTVLRKLGHAEAKRKINSGLSMFIPISHTDEKLTDSTDNSPLRNASSNWKHNLRRGQKRATFEQIATPDPVEICATYQALQETKKIGEQFSASSISAMIEEFGKNLIVFGSRDAHGKLIAMRACIIVGKTAWDIWAAATDDARKNYTSHVLLEQLLLFVQNSKLEGYDLSGIDPRLAGGVYNFKKGTGARHIEYLGEWDFGSNYISLSLNLYLRINAAVRKFLI